MDLNNLSHQNRHKLVDNFPFSSRTLPWCMQSLNSGVEAGRDFADYNRGRYDKLGLFGLAVGSAFGIAGAFGAVALTVVAFMVDVAWTLILLFGSIVNITILTPRAAHSIKFRDDGIGEVPATVVGQCPGPVSPPSPSREAAYTVVHGQRDPGSSQQPELPYDTPDLESGLYTGGLRFRGRPGDAGPAG